MTKRNSIWLFLILLSMVGCKKTNPKAVQQLASSFNFYQAPETEPVARAQKSVPHRDNCLFAFRNFDQAFIDGIAAFKKGDWDLPNSTTYISLDQNEQLTLVQEGCDYYSLAMDWYKPNNEHELDEVSYWLAQTDWLYKRILEPHAYAEFKRLCKDENYHLKKEAGILTLSFTNHEYSEWYIRVSRNQNGETNLKTGYYYN